MRREVDGSDTIRSRVESSRVVLSGPQRDCLGAFLYLDISRIYRRVARGPRSRKFQPGPGAPFFSFFFSPISFHLEAPGEGSESQSRNPSYSSAKRGKGKAHTRCALRSPLIPRASCGAPRPSARAVASAGQLWLPSWNSLESETKAEEAGATRRLSKSAKMEKMAWLLSLVQWGREEDGSEMQSFAVWNASSTNTIAPASRSGSPHSN